QQKIKGLLQYLEKKYAITTIFVEGASEDLNPDYLKLFPDAERNLKLADFLAKQGELTGAELYLLEADKAGLGTRDSGLEKQEHGLGTRDLGLEKTSNENESRASSPERRAVQAHGLEDAALYRENYEALKKVFGAEGVVKQYLDGLEGRLTTLGSKVFSKDLLRMTSEWKKFEKGHRVFMPYVRNLAGESKRVLDVDLESLLSQIEWPQITRLLVLQQMEKELELAKGIAEKDQLVQFLKAKSTSADLVTAIENFKDQRVSILRAANGGAATQVKPRDLMEQLVTEAGPKGFRFYDYPNFSLYAGYLILKSELDPKGLFAEIQKIFTKILDQLAQVPEQKHLLELYRREELVRKLLNLELTRKDWQEVLAQKDLLAMDTLVAELKAIEKAVSRETGAPLTAFETQAVKPEFRSQVMDVQSAAYNFYDAARRREDVFYEKISSVMQKRSLDKAVVITGGFHTDGITELLREHEISYGVLTPRLSENSDENHYRNVMLQSKPRLFEVSYLENPSRAASLKTLRDQGMNPADVVASMLDAAVQASGRSEVRDILSDVNASPFTQLNGIQIFDTTTRTTAGKSAYKITRSEVRKVDSAGLGTRLSGLDKTRGQSESRGASDESRGAAEGVRRSELRTNEEIQRDILKWDGYRNGARARAVRMLEINREFMRLFAERDMVRKEQGEGAAERAQMFLDKARGFAVNLKIFADRIRPEGKEEAFPGEAALYQEINQLAQAATLEQAGQALKEKSQVLSDKIKELRLQFPALHAEGNKEALDRLNREVTAYYKARLKVQLLQTRAYLQQEDLNQSVLLTMLMALALNYTKLSREYGWQWRRAIEEAAVRKIQVVSRAGKLNHVYDYENFRITVGKDETPVEVKQSAWLKQESPDGVAQYVPGVVTLKFDDIDAAFRSQIHTLMKQEQDYSVVLGHSLDLDYWIDMLKSSPVSLVTQEEQKLMEKDLWGILAWLKPGKVSEKVKAREEIETALTALRGRAKGYLKTVWDHLEMAKTALKDQRLPDIERIKRAVESRADGFANILRLSETNRAANELEGLAKAGSFAEGEQLLDLLYRTHYLHPVSRAEQYSRLQNLVFRLKGNFGRLAKPGATPELKGFTLNQITQDLQTAKELTKRSEMRKVDSAGLRTRDSLDARSEMREIKDLIEARYGLHVVGEPGILTGGFFGESRDHPPYSVKIRERGSLAFKYIWDTRQRARFAVELMQRLKNEGRPVPELIPRTDIKDAEDPSDAYIVEHRGAFYVLETLLEEGNEILREEATEAHYFALGELAARIQNAVQGFKPRHVFRYKDRLDIYQGMLEKFGKFDEILGQLQGRYGEENAMVQGLLRDREELKTLLRAQLDIFGKNFPVSGLKRSYIHNDLHFANLKFAGAGKISAVFDFNSAQEDIRVLEFNNLILGTKGPGSAAIDPVMFRAALRGYEGTLKDPLTPEERVAIWEVLRLRLIEAVLLSLFAPPEGVGAINPFLDPKMAHAWKASLDILKRFGDAPYVYEGADITQVRSEMRVVEADMSESQLTKEENRSKEQSVDPGPTLVTLANVREGGIPVRLRISLLQPGEFEIAVVVDGKKVGDFLLERQGTYLQTDQMFIVGNERTDSYGKYKGKGIANTILNWIAWEAQKNGLMLRNRGTTRQDLLRLFHKYFGGERARIVLEGRAGRPFSELIEKYGFYGTEIWGGCWLRTVKEGKEISVSVRLSLKRSGDSGNRYRVVEIEQLPYPEQDLEALRDALGRFRTGDEIEINENGAIAGSPYFFVSGKRTVRIEGPPSFLKVPRMFTVRAELPVIGEETTPEVFFKRSQWKAHSWSEIGTLLRAAAAEGSLTHLYVDIDNTLTSPQGFHNTVKQIDQMNEALPAVIDRIAEEERRMAKHRFYRLVRGLEAELLRDLRSTGVRVVALTARPPEAQARTLA
ncbi:MAG: phosphotransferase, partial [Candidatus Omnitrophica bacterium]|nr:phosphotransferase [Candidatus Omnitrophota bacterium]